MTLKTMDEAYLRIIMWDIVGPALLICTYDSCVVTSNDDTAVIKVLIHEDQYGKL